MTEDSKMNRANALRSSVAPAALLRVVALGGAIAMGSTLPAEAARYWSESDSGYYSQQQFEQPPPRRQQRARSKAPSKKDAQVVKDTTVHPQMPLIINVSIAKQKVRIYDANGFFAEAPVSTGMPGHSTPMGVFSVIQKDRYHHSNIYSGAPMPYMQRITWSGIALHEGVLPGHPASHGCIRMPGAFAVKMWGWTKMGARVIVTPGELEPATFAHALLPTVKVAPLPAVAETDPVAAKADKGPPEIKPIEANLELRSSVGHSDNAKPSEDPPRRTADATRSSNAVMTDASPSAPAKADEKADAGKPDAAGADESKTATNAGTKPDTAPAASSTDTPAASGDAAKPVEVADAAKPEDRVVTAGKPADVTVAEAKTTDAAKPVDAAKPEAAKADAAKPDTAKPATAKVDTPKPDAAKADAAKTDTAKAADKPVDPNKAKDQTRLTDKSAREAKQREEQRKGQIAVFISRKDSKLYVRQNFQPLFEVPVTIAQSDRPMGTHVFTAQVDKADSNALRWTVITVPPSARAAMRDSDDPRASRRKGKGKATPAPVEAKPLPVQNTPAEALDRITVPPEVMTRISEAMTSGASIIVSDQGIAQGETGEYTDFIVRYY
jgi:lipoprotein-anchoring transpeptidase ErfK/SrfK